jgi:hypothetical protein
MLRARPLCVVAFGAMLLEMAAGCSSVDQLPDPNPASETLVVGYGDPGPTPDPCDDRLPIIDGTPTDVEWDIAQPLFVHMTGVNGSGGGEYFLEIRAIWTDESRVGGTDRVYFLVRYPDNDQNNAPDLLGYIRPAGGELCEHGEIVGGAPYCPSPSPRVGYVEMPSQCDSLLASNGFWTRLNENGREDQVFFYLTQVGSSADDSRLIELNRKVLGTLGPKSPEDAADQDVGSAGTEDTDVWAWRAGRTNLHPVPQFADWGTLAPPDKPIPDPAFSRFTINSGFCEDLWVSGGFIHDDAGTTPFLRNFGTTNPENGFIRFNEATQETMDTVPIFLTQCPEGGRESDDDLAALNGGLPKDLALWRPSAHPFNRFGCDSLACSRSGAKPPKWSKNPLPQVPTTLLNFDFIQGWALRVPFTPGGPISARDVRARGAYGATQDKGFGVWSLEVMRNLDTHQSDDMVITPGASGEYRMVIGVLDASGKVGSGSTEIRLKFTAPSAGPRWEPRC